MSIVVPYHIGKDGLYSLDFITDDKQVMERHISGRHNELDRIITEKLDMQDTTLYLVYSKNKSITMQLDEVLDSVNLDEFTQGQLSVLEVILDVFEGIRGKPRTVETFRLYKPFDLEKIPTILEYPDWGNAPVTDLAGQLLSKFVQSHPLPNANHRTAIGLIERYLRTISDDLEIPPTGDKGKWYSWAQPFIYESKILLTVRRRSRLFAHAERLGVHVIERKDGLIIDLRNYDFTVSNPYTHYGNQHEQRSIEFIETILRESDVTDSEFTTKKDPGFDSFVESLID